ncbi:MAG TPA: hypothetical protein VER03_26405, partial [Bryobacteraceae bacterium]|nr:hypothetical protein [Bryobacteraceae bacterium]
RHAWKGNPDVEARGLRVGGNLLLSPADGENRSAIGRGASIAGVLRMPSGSCAQLVFSGQNFTSGATVQPRIDLERSVFRRFELLYPLPESIDLSNVRVDRWDIAGEGLENDPHIELLGRTVPFRTGAYAEVERALREQGNTDLADQVYVSMRRAATGEKLKRLRTETNAMGGSLRSTVLRLSRLRRFLSCITDASNDFFIGYGTKPYRLIAIVIFLTIPSLLVFSNPRNVVASMEVVDANASIQFADPLNVHPHQVGYKWSAWDASIMTVRYHVPIVGNALSPRFEPTREPVTLPGWMYVSWSPLPAVPGHFWASAMTWTNWLLWTLLLIVVARNIRVRMAGGG